MRDKLEQVAGYVAMAGVLLALAALGGWAVQERLELWSSVALGLGVALLALAVVVKPEPVVRALTGRRARYGSNAVVMTLSFLVIVGVVNYIGGRYHWRWDTTATKEYSLSEQTRQIVQALDEPVSLKAFFTPTHYNRIAAEDILQEYVALAPSLISAEVIDPELNRQAAVEAGVGRDGVVVVQKGDRVEYAFGVAEQDLTSAILKLTQERQRGVYFVTGHGERSPDSYEDNGYGAVGQGLEAENYAVDTINLATVSAIPEAVDVLAVVDPRTAFQQAEIDLLLGFLESGGGVLVMVEPGLPDPFGGALEAYGVSLPDALLLDPAKAFYGDAATPLVDSYGYHQITKDVMGYSSLYPGARPVVLTEDPPEEWYLTELAVTSPQGEAEWDYRGTGQATGEPLTGALPLAVAIEPAYDREGVGRMVVFGDATFVENSVVSQVMGVSNADLFLNSVAWLAEDESLISLRATEPEDRSVALSGVTMNLVLLFSAVVMPALVAAIGVGVWWRRR